MAEAQKQRVREEQESGEEIKLKQKTTINLKFVSMGREPVELTVEKGTTLKEIVDSQRATGLEIRVKSLGAAQAERVPLTNQMQEGDLVVAIPIQISGGV